MGRSGIAAAVFLAVLAPAVAAPARRAPGRRPGVTKPGPAAKAAPPAKPAALALDPVDQTFTEDEARRAVSLLDDAYQTLLHEVHRHYPTKPGRPVAATVVRDVQKLMTEKGWPSSRFLGVNAILMNPDHAARDAFEKDAVGALRRYEKEYEEVRPGLFRKATMVSLGAECTSCHWPAMNEASRAGITWAVRLKPAPK